MHTRLWALLLLSGLVACGSSEPGVTPDGDPTGTTSTDTETSSTDTGTEGPGSACGTPLEGQYGDCLNQSKLTCGNPDSKCLLNDIEAPHWGVCSLPCEDVCDCWAAPPGATAEAACERVPQGGGDVCILDCGDGKTCPSGMRCAVLTSAVQFCVYDNEMPPDGTDTGGTGDTDTGDTSTGDTGSDDTGTTTTTTTTTTTGT